MAESDHGVADVSGLCVFLIHGTLRRGARFFTAAILDQSGQSCIAWPPCWPDVANAGLNVTRTILFSRLSLRFTPRDPIPNRSPPRRTECEGPAPLLPPHEPRESFCC